MKTTTLTPELFRLLRDTVAILEKLPPGTRLGDNSNAFKGGCRLWNKRYSGSTLERFVH